MIAPKPTVPEVLPLVRSVYRRHSAGCCWHVVLDDGNTAAEFVRYCAEAILRSDARERGEWCGNQDCRELAELLPRMSRTQVTKLGSMKRG